MGAGFDASMRLRSLLQGKCLGNGKFESSLSHEVKGLPGHCGEEMRCGLTQCGDAVANHSLVRVPQFVGGNRLFGISAGIPKDHETTKGSKHAQTLAACRLSACIEHDVNSLSIRRFHHGLLEPIDREDLVVAKSHELRNECVEELISIE